MLMELIYCPQGALEGGRSCNINYESIDKSLKTIETALTCEQPDNVRLFSLITSLLPLKGCLDCYLTNLKLGDDSLKTINLSGNDQLSNYIKRFKNLIETISINYEIDYNQLKSIINSYKPFEKEVTGDLLTDITDQIMNLLNPNEILF